LRGAPPPDDNDLLTVAAIAIIPMCVVSFDHEALGHGSACLLLQGHIRLLTSSLFYCDTRSGWIDPAGPVSNLLIGTLALLSLRSVPARWLKLRLGLILVTAFSFFWEGAYLIRAMLKRDGDLYFFAEFILGEVSALQRCAAVAGGIVLYIFAARITVAAFASFGPAPKYPGRLPELYGSAPRWAPLLPPWLTPATVGVISRTPFLRSAGHLFRFS
jgi:hypothetical protein